MEETNFKEEMQKALDQLNSMWEKHSPILEGLENEKASN